MKSPFVAAVFAAITLCAFPSMARTPVPIVNYTDVGIAASNAQNRSPNHVRQAILTALHANGWTGTAPEDGKLVATLNVRGKHTVIVDITYGADKYSLGYKDSINMKYGQQNGQAVIHPFYNRWIDDLRNAIDRELQKPSPV